MKRHTDALACQLGACNPSAIAAAIVSACAEMRENEITSTNALCDDPAIRLMVHQLSFLCHTSEIDKSLTVYSDLQAVCEIKAD